MLDSLIPLLKSYRLSSHVQRWVVLQVQALAVHQPVLLQACAAALAAITTAVNLRRDYERTRRRYQGSDLAHQLDLQIDKLVCAAHGRLASLRREGGPLGGAAAYLLDLAFPRGLKQHVSAPHVEQVTHNAALRDLLRDPAHAEVVGYLRLDDLCARLDELGARFEQALAAQNRVTGVMVHEAERAGENAVLKLLCGIVFCFDEADPEQRRTRDRLLEPFLGAQELLQQEHKRQAPKVDLQPVGVVEPARQEPEAGTPAAAQEVVAEPAQAPPVQEPPVQAPPVPEAPRPVADCEVRVAGGRSSHAAGESDWSVEVQGEPWFDAVLAEETVRGRSGRPSYGSGPPRRHELPRSAACSR